MPRTAERYGHLRFPRFKAHRARKNKSRSGPTNIQTGSAFRNQAGVGRVCPTCHARYIPIPATATAIEYCNQSGKLPRLIRYLDVRCPPPLTGGISDWLILPSLKESNQLPVFSFLCDIER